MKVRKKRGLDKKAVSPVIATVLLILIVLILALIILIWSMGFLKEAVVKEIDGNKKRVNEFCGEVKMQKILNPDGTFGFANLGRIPIYAINLKVVEKGTGSSETYEIGKSKGGRVNPGVSTIIRGYNYDSYEKVTLIPVLIGTHKSGGLRDFECPERNGLII